jgi:hypothetical protein
MAEPTLYAYVDNSNVLIEGRRFAEMKRKGRSTRSAFKDDSYEIDWGKFLYILKERDTRALADIPTLYGSRPPAETLFGSEYETTASMSNCLTGTYDIRKRVLIWRWAWT